MKLLTKLHQVLAIKVLRNY